MNDIATDLQKLLDARDLDDETVQRLAAADHDEMRRVLSTWLPDDDVERMLRRVQALVEARAQQHGQKR